MTRQRLDQAPRWPVLVLGGLATALLAFGGELLCLLDQALDVWGDEPDDPWGPA